MSFELGWNFRDYLCRVFFSSEADAFHGNFLSSCIVRFVSLISLIYIIPLLAHQHVQDSKPENSPRGMPNVNKLLEEGFLLHFFSNIFVLS